jgi:hypothetical protein
MKVGGEAVSGVRPDFQRLPVAAGTRVSARTSTRIQQIRKNNGPCVVFTLTAVLKSGHSSSRVRMSVSRCSAKKHAAQVTHREVEPLQPFPSGGCRRPEFYLDNSGMVTNMLDSKRTSKFGSE